MFFKQNILSLLVRVNQWVSTMLYLATNRNVRNITICVNTPSQTGLKHNVIERVARSARLAQIDQRKASAPYQTTGEWIGILEGSTHNIQGAIEQANLSVISHLLANMFRLEGQTEIGSIYSPKALEGFSLKGLIKRTCIIQGEHQDIQTLTQLMDVNVSELAAPNIGNPWGVLVEGNLLYPGVCRAQYFACQVAALLEREDKSTVAEIGGGYGEFAYRLLKKKNIQYVCFDLPEILIKSSYFLMNAFPDKRFLLYGEAKDDLSDIKDFDVIMMPNFLLGKLPALSVDVLVNMRSLSEMGRNTVNEYLKEIFRVTRQYFIHENSNTTVRQLPSESGKHIEVPASEFPISSEFVKIYGHKSPWVGSGRYVEYLYMRK